MSRARAAVCVPLSVCMYVHYGHVLEDRYLLIICCFLPKQDEKRKQGDQRLPAIKVAACNVGLRAEETVRCLSEPFDLLSPAPPNNNYCNNNTLALNRYIKYITGDCL